MIAVANEAANGLMIENNEQSLTSYAQDLRITVTISVGFATELGKSVASMKSAKRQKQTSRTDIPGIRIKKAPYIQVRGLFLTQALRLHPGS